MELLNRRAPELALNLCFGKPVKKLFYDNVFYLVLVCFIFTLFYFGVIQAHYKKMSNPPLILLDSPGSVQFRSLLFHKREFFLQQFIKY